MSNLAYADVIEDLPILYTYRVGKGAKKMPKQKKSEIDDSKIKIVHTMADGTVRETINGYEIPYNDTTSTVYKLLAKWAMEDYE